MRHLLLASLLSAAFACGGGDSAAPDAAPTPDGATVPDAAPGSPVPGAALTLGARTSTSIDVGWGAATADETPTGELTYRVVRASSAAALDTLPEALAISGADVVRDFTTGPLAATTTGLEPEHTYAFAVIVRDGDGLDALYAPITGTTFPTLPHLAAGGAFACAIINDAGAVKCWGDNYDGKLGLGDMSVRGDAPGEMGDNLATVDLGAGRSALGIYATENHTCAILDGGDVKCWGNNNAGKLGLGDVAPRGRDPGQMGDALPTVDLGTGRTAVELALSIDHTCARLDDGSVKCWGLNASGQLGLGDREDRGDEPGEMGDALPAVDLGAGRTAVRLVAGDVTCAILDDGALKCWGYGYKGALGIGTSEIGGDPGEMGDALPAVDLGTGRSAVDIVAGGQHACAILDDATTKCWGVGGLLGIGSTDALGDQLDEMGDALPVVALGTGRSARHLAAAGGNTPTTGHTCAILDDGSVKCWGTNELGELGLGDTSTRGDETGEMGDALSAVDLGAGRHAVEIATGSYVSCARLDDDSIKCWGYGLALGQGSTEHRGDEPGEMGDALPAIAL
jgi:hypothetical protein